jgi:protease-4
MSPSLFRAVALLSGSLSLLAAAGGCGTPSFLITPISNSTRLQERVVQPGKAGTAEKVAMIEVEGMLMNARVGGLFQAQENRVSLFAQQMRAAARDPAVKAVVLRVNSPGGTVTASDTMYEIVKEFRRKTNKPVVAAAQEVCASGAYYVACAADKIVAQPTSVVGSIGVMMNTMEFEGALSKLGIRADAIKSGPLKDMGSPYRTMGEPERAVMQEMVDEYFTRFIDVVSANRTVGEPRPSLPLEEDYRGVYSGRVFSGLRAVELGLADQAGGLGDAITLAKQLGKARGAKVVMYKRPYGYGGSIYASSDPVPRPKAEGERNVVQLELPNSRLFLPGGFYYLWEP